MKRTTPTDELEPKRVKSNLSYGLYSVRLGGFLDIVKELPKNKRLVFTPKQQFYPRLAGLGAEEDAEEMLCIKTIDGETVSSTLVEIHMSDIDFKTEIEWDLGDSEEEEIVDSEDEEESDDGSRSPQHSDADDSKDEDYEEISVDKFIAKICSDLGYHSVPPLKIEFRLDRKAKCPTLSKLIYDVKQN